MRHATRAALACLAWALPQACAAQGTPSMAGMPPMPGMTTGDAPRGGHVAKADDAAASMGLVLMLLGHLSVAEELVRSGRLDEATAHFEHLGGSMAASMGPWLAGLGDDGFASQTHGLLMAARAGDAPRVLIELAGARHGLGVAMERLRSGAPDPASAVLRGAIAAVKAAAPEYGASLKGREVTGRTDWEDGRGFVAEAERAFEEVAPTLVARRGDGAVARVRGDFARLHATWPTPFPPTEAVTPPDVLQSDVDLLAADAAALR